MSARSRRALEAASKLWNDISGDVFEQPLHERSEQLVASVAERYAEGAFRLHHRDNGSIDSLADKWCLTITKGARGKGNRQACPVAQGDVNLTALHGDIDESQGVVLIRVVERGKDGEFVGVRRIRGADIRLKTLDECECPRGNATLN